MIDHRMAASSCMCRNRPSFLFLTGHVHICIIILCRLFFSKDYNRKRNSGDSIHNTSNAFISFGRRGIGQGTGIRGHDPNYSNRRIIGSCPRIPCVFPYRAFSPTAPKCRRRRHHETIRAQRSRSRMRGVSGAEGYVFVHYRAYSVITLLNISTAHARCSIAV